MTASLEMRDALPEGPAASSETRDRHVAAALARFDGAPRNVRPRPRPRSVTWRRARPALAASALLALAAPVAWRIVEERRTETVSAGKPPIAIAEPPASRPLPDALDLPPVPPVVTVPADMLAAPPPSRTGPTVAVAPSSPKTGTEYAHAMQRPEPTRPPAAGRAGRTLGAVPPPSVAQPSPMLRNLSAGSGPSRTRSVVAESRVPMPPEPGRRAEPVGRDRFAGAEQSPFRAVAEAPVSTFSVDVDTASYAFLRASLATNVLPPPAAIRTEELVNYFPYDDPASADPARPFRTSVAVFPSPWAEGRKLVRIAVKGYAVPAATRPRANLVFLIDTSGSMDAPNRLPLVKQSLALLVGGLGPDDRVAIVTYAGRAGTLLEPIAASEKGRILAAIDGLEAGGGTAGGEGIRQAYALAARNFDPGGVNRVMLATDGDFNVGIRSQDELKGFVERERGRGIFLSVLGFGMGNYNDALMQTLAQNGNGAAAYIDTIAEARKVMVEEATSTLIPIATDVKIQVEFNPARVQEYRLIGYETRALAREDFTNDKVDAGDVGSGQGVTALYEIVPVGAPPVAGEMRYGRSAPAAAVPPVVARPPAGDAASEYAFVKIRYKLPKAETSELIATPVGRGDEVERFEAAPTDARFATAVAAFGEILRGGRHTGRLGLDDVLRIASAARGDDPYGYRTEFLGLVRAAKTASTLPSARP